MFFGVSVAWILAGDPSIKKTTRLHSRASWNMVFPRFVTETHPGWKGTRDVRDGPSNWPGVKQLEKPPKRLTCRIQGRGSSLVEPVASCWRCCFESQARLQVVRSCLEWAAFGRNRWRSSSGHSADWFWERCPFLARKWGPSFVKILCPLYVSQLLRIFVYSSRAYVFFIFLPISGECKQVLTRYQSGMTLGPAKCIFCFQIARGGSLINYHPDEFFLRITASTLVPCVFRLARDDGLILEVVGRVTGLPRERHDVSGKCVVYIF